MKKSLQKIVEFFRLIPIILSSIIALDKDLLLTFMQPSDRS